QKIDAIGHTNVQQQESDVICGVRDLRSDNLDLKILYRDMTENRVTPHQHGL
ncbi:hypothetical protein SASC598P14_002170, partial [Snodgrassella alvi SCGC AB-598-P14]